MEQQVSVLTVRRSDRQTQLYYMYIMTYVGLSASVYVYMLAIPFLADTGHQPITFHAEFLLSIVTYSELMRMFRFLLWCCVVLCQFTHIIYLCEHFCSEWRIVGCGTGTLWDFWIRSNQPVTGGFPSQKASNVENDSIWWCHLMALCYNVKAVRKYAMFRLQYNISYWITA